MNVFPDPYKQYYFLKECNEDFQLEYVVALTDLGFMLKSKKIWKKKIFFKQNTKTKNNKKSKIH